MNIQVIDTLIKEVEEDCANFIKFIIKTDDTTQHKVLQDVKEAQIGDHHFTSTDVYGYDDMDRDKLEEVYANVFGGEDALVRPQLVSGTHAISTALFSMLLPGDELVYITGSPYNTL